MASPDTVLATRARRAYERGRVRAALPTVVFVAPMVALSLFLCGERAASAAAGTVLAIVLVMAGWRGQDYAAGARAGLLAGFGPLVLPLGTCWHLCVGGVCLLAPGVCVGAGLLAGALVGLLARRRFASAEGRRPSLATALLVAGLVGSLGCVIAGLSGVAGMALGLAAGTVPVVWWPARAA